jgi:hypothetical protein
VQFVKQRMSAIDSFPYTDRIALNQTIHPVPVGSESLPTTEAQFLTTVAARRLQLHQR